MIDHVYLDDTWERGVDVRDNPHIMGTVGLIRVVHWKDPDPIIQWSTLYRASPVFMAPQCLRCLHKPLSPFRSLSFTFLQSSPFLSNYKHENFDIFMCVGKEESLDQ